MNYQAKYIVNEVFRDYGDRTDVLIILQDRLASINLRIKNINLKSTKTSNSSYI
tara:strand:- start:325 stop:486 length:162 start_codon:yes stop_codon:yes gene_type:complete